MGPYEILKEGFETYGLSYNDTIEQRFSAFTGELLRVNEVMNLTAITEPEEVMRKHYLDSVFPLTLPYIPEGAKVIDVGCGAGFPGLPMKLARDDIQLTLLDALQKRIGFLQGCVELIGLQGVECIHARAEEGAQKPQLREQYDVAVSRAVANLRTLTELCCGYIKEGGYFIALKGPGAQAEVDEAKNAIGTMGCKVVEVIDAPIPGLDTAHCCVVIQKIKPTDPKYPRNFGRIRKKPL
jgi:16S rRNA (guanine527-N7)-methyltransferase